MLPIAIHRQSPFKSPFKHPPPTDPQGGALAASLSKPDDLRAGIFGQRRGLISRSVIDDPYGGQVRPHRRDERLDFPRLIQAGNNHRALGCPVHAAKLESEITVSSDFPKEAKRQAREPVVNH